MFAPPAPDKRGRPEPVLLHWKDAWPRLSEAVQHDVDVNAAWNVVLDMAPIASGGAIRLRDVAADRHRVGQAFAVVASCAMSAAAASEDEAGFWPVISRPSLTTYEPQSGPFE